MLKRNRYRQIVGQEQKIHEGVRLLRTLEGHTDVVLSITFDSEGRVLASGSADRTVKLWEADTGKLLRTLEGHVGYVFSVAFDPEGLVLASGSHDGTVKLWEAATGQLLHTLEGHMGPVWSVGFDPEGRILVSESFESNVMLWNVGSGKLLGTLEGHENIIRSIAFDPTGLVLASAGDDQTVRLWDVSSGKPLSTLKGHMGPVWSVAFDPEGRILASGGDDQTVRLWRVASGKPLRTLNGHTGSIDAVSFSRDGRYLASSSRDGTLRLWSCKTWDPIAVISVPTPDRWMPNHAFTDWWIPGLTFHPSLPLLATVDLKQGVEINELSGLIRFWELDLDLADLSGADKEEHTARNELAQFAYEPALEHLQAAMGLDPDRIGRLQEEFGFLFAFQADKTVQAIPKLRWCTEIWRILSYRNSFTLPELQSLQQEVTEDREEELINLGNAGAVASGRRGRDTESGHSASPEEKGEQLEEAVARLFRTFFLLGDDVPWKIRKQKRGTQGGFDLSIEWSGTYETAPERRARCHIECKNYQDAITPAQVAEKLLSEPRLNPVIDHWILISPRSNPSNELNRFLEQQEKEETFPFQVQVWCPETGIDELFGLEPDVYDYFFSPLEGEPHPRTWDQTRRDEVRARWRARLTPPMRLPRGWNDYMRDPALLCIHKEVPEKMENAYGNYVTMHCRNLAGVLLERPLESYVDDWLESPDKQVLFLLGEFGDGKSFFTYVKTRRLITQLAKDRGRGWLPLRLALSKFPGNAREFLRQRLEEFNADVGGWRELGKTSRRLVILDGFDEISVKLDPETITQNIEILLECAEEFEGCKLLITSRTHFFQHKKDAQRLLERLGETLIYHLAPIPRGQVLEHLAQAVPEMTAQQVLRRVQSMNDPIGLASKPLFLEMLKEVLYDPDLPKDLDVVTLYERYIIKSLERKHKLLDDPKLKTSPRETVANLRNILGEIAEDLQRTGQGYAALNKFQSAERKPFAELLWQLSGEDGLEQDARSRVGARSLLARVTRPEIEEELPVDFCHRSMREYFVSTRLCQAIEEGEDAGSKFLQEVPLNHEILDFAAEQLRKNGPHVALKLRALIHRAVPANNPGRLGGYALTLLHRIDPILPREFDWTGKVFDGADMEEADFTGINFSRSSFRYANLANAIFEDSIFEDCDLTGVRIEETAHVIAIGIAPSREDLVAAYGDNQLRQWSTQQGRRTISKVIGNIRVEPSSAIGIHESGQPWMRIGQEWLFFDLQDDQTWKLLSRFPIKDVIEEPRPQGHLITLVEENADSSLHVVLIDLSKQIKLAAARANAVRHCIAMGVEAIAWSDAIVGVRVKSVSQQSLSQEMTLRCTEPSCIDALGVAEGRHLLAVGTSEGRVIVWELDLRMQEWSECKLLDLRAHDGPVTSVVFQHATKLASGSSDRSIALSTWDETGDGSGMVERRLLLKLRCKGMRIEGLQTDTERAQLAKLIEESSAKTTQ